MIRALWHWTCPSTRSTRRRKQRSCGGGLLARCEQGRPLWRKRLYPNDISTLFASVGSRARVDSATESAAAKLLAQRAQFHRQKLLLLLPPLLLHLRSQMHRVPFLYRE